VLQDFLGESGLYNPLIQTWEQSKCWLQDRVVQKDADASNWGLAFPFQI
jgi:hypothetical protein